MSDPTELLKEAGPVVKSAPEKVPDPSDLLDFVEIAGEALSLIGHVLAALLHF